MHRIVLIAALTTPLLATAQEGGCPNGYQPYENRCVTQRMADYISCIEASGGNRLAISHELTQIDGNETGGGVSASGGNAVVRAEGTLTLDKKSEYALVRKLETRWFRGGTSECAKVLNQQSRSVIPPEVRRTLDHIASGIPHRAHPVIDLSVDLATQIQLFATDEVTIVGIGNVDDEISGIQLGYNIIDFSRENIGAPNKFMVWGNLGEPITPIFFGKDGQQMNKGNVKLVVEYRDKVNEPRDLREFEFLEGV